MEQGLGVKVFSWENLVASIVEMIRIFMMMITMVDCLVFPTCLD